MEAPMPTDAARPNGNPSAQGLRDPKITRQGLIEAIGLLIAHLPDNVLYMLWKLLSYPPAQLRRAQMMIVNCPESADLFYDAIRLDRIIRYLDAKTEESLLADVDNAEAKAEVRRVIEQFRGRVGMGITILRTMLGEVSQKYKLSFRGLSRLGAYNKIYERSGQKLFERGGDGAQASPDKPTWVEVR
jgi:hypothetical protein